MLELSLRHVIAVSDVLIIAFQVLILALLIFILHNAQRRIHSLPRTGWPLVIMGASLWLISCLYALVDIIFSIEGVARWEWLSPYVRDASLLLGIVSMMLGVMLWLAAVGRKLRALTSGQTTMASGSRDVS